MACIYLCIHTDRPKQHRIFIPQVTPKKLVYTLHMRVDLQRLLRRHEEEGEARQLR